MTEYPAVGSFWIHKYKRHSARESYAQVTKIAPVIFSDHAAIYVHIVYPYSTYPEEVFVVEVTDFLEGCTQQDPPEE